MKKNQRVEIMFDVPRGEGIYIELDEEDSQSLIDFLKEGKEPTIFFPDYEDE